MSDAGEGSGTPRLARRSVVGKRGAGGVGGGPAYGWDVEVAYVGGLFRRSCGIQGLHEDLEAEQARDPSGFLVHWPISGERELGWWPGGHKLIRRVGELLESRDLHGDHVGNTATGRAGALATTPFS